MNVLDTNDIPITSVSLQQPESTDGPVIVIRIPCLAGQFLVADDNADARVLVRETGVGIYQDVGTTPFDLSPYDGATQDFDMKTHTNSVIGIVHHAIDVEITYNP